MTHLRTSFSKLTLFFIILLVAFFLFFLGFYLKSTGYAIVCSGLAVENVSVPEESGTSKKVDLYFRGCIEYEPSPKPEYPLPPGGLGGGSALSPTGHCETDSQCSEYSYCFLGVCISKKGLGKVCAEDKECVSGYCINRFCGIPYCSVDWDCRDYEHCLNGVCEKIMCSCGTVKAHTCIPFECCSNLDCGKNGICDVVKHVCVVTTKDKLVVEFSPLDPGAGEFVSFSVKDGVGKPVEGVIFSVMGKKFVSNSDGLALIRFEESGAYELIAEKEGYVPDKIVLYVLKKLVITYSVEGSILRIRVSDHKGFEVPFAQVSISWENGSRHVFFTDASGLVKVPARTGKLFVSASKPGYKSSSIPVVVSFFVKGFIENFFSDCRFLFFVVPYLLGFFLIVVFSFLIVFILSKFKKVLTKWEIILAAFLLILIILGSAFVVSVCFAMLIGLLIVFLLLFQYSLLKHLRKIGGAFN